jgi:hypothetical protein
MLQGYHTRYFGIGYTTHIENHSNMIRKKISKQLPYKKQ